MQFIVENEKFANALGLAKGCIRASTIPILAHIAVSAKASVVTVRATNQEREIEAEVPAEVAIEGGVALPGEVLAGLVRRLPKGGELALALKGDRATIVSGTASFDLRTLPLVDFPEFREMPDDAVTFDVPCTDLKRLINETVYATYQGTMARLFERGVYLHVAGNKLLAAATDSHRLALASADMPRGSATMPGVVVPADAAQAIAQLLGDREGDVRLTVSPQMFEVRLGNVRLSTVLIECAYPDYGRIVPTPTSAAATFRPYALSEALKRASAVYLGLGAKDINKQAPVARIDTGNNAIRLETGEGASERASETVEAETNGHDLSIAMNADYLAEMLGVWPETVTLSIEQHNPAAPILFTAAERPDMTHVIMPMKR